MNVNRKNYSTYKDGLPVCDLSASKLKAIERGMCIKAILKNGTKLKIRVRLKPAKKLTLAQENAKLRKELAKLRKGADNA
jgi:hypothetical protein